MDPAHTAVTTHPLPLTGERTVPGVPDETYWFQRHVVAYEAAAPLARGASVLDAGCGEGYGLRLLADAGATRVLGADLDEASVDHARRTYAHADPRLDVVACELREIPAADETFDLTVSFQVVEHVHDVPGYLASLRRVTRRGGVVVLATPNRLTFTPDSDTPVNPFHVREFTGAELRTEVEAAGLAVEELLGVHHGSRLRAAEEARGSTLPGLLTTIAPQEWDAPLRELVHSVTAADFDLTAADIDASLDLYAVCRVP